jgi:hypothetical protein
MAEKHPRSAVDIAQLDGPSLGSWVITRIHNRHAPLARCTVLRSGSLRREPIQTRLPRLLEPVVICNCLCQLFARTADSSVETASLVAPQGTQREFYRGTRRGLTARISIKLRKTPLGGPKLCTTSSATMITRSLAWGTIFFHSNAAPPPLIRFRSASISSAPSIVRSTARSMSAASSGMPSHRASYSLASDGAKPTTALSCPIRNNGARSRVAKIAVELAPSPIVFPDCTNSEVPNFI